MKPSFIKYYILLLIVHIVHIIEEAIGNAKFIESTYLGLRNFLIINILLWIIPILIFYFLIKKNKIAFYLSFVYAIIMVLDGISHIFEFFNINTYISSVAGLFTGTIFIPVGVLLIYSLSKDYKK